MAAVGGVVLMRFFDKKRPEVYLHNCKLRRDKKTGTRLWGFTLIVTFTVELAESCDVPVAKAWQYITERDSAAVDVMIASEVASCSIDFFAQADDADAALHLEGVDLVGLRLTRDKQVVEFWFGGEHENNSRLHAFMKEYAYTRCWAQFSPQQRDLQIPEAEKLANDPKFMDAADRIASSVRTGEISRVTISGSGMEPVVIDKDAAERIHARAQAAKGKKS